MNFDEISKSSKTQDKQNSPTPSIFNKMEMLGYLPTSMHEIRMYETDDRYYIYSIDRRQMILWNMTKPIASCHVQLYKKLHTYAHLDLSDPIYTESPQVGWVYTSTSYKHMDIAIEMYDFLIKKYGAIWSDVKHSAGATVLWERIAKKYQVDMIDFNKGKIIKEGTKSARDDGWYDKREYLLLARYGE